MMGIESFRRIDSLAGSAKGAEGRAIVSSTTVLDDPPVPSESGDGVIGNLKSASAAEGVRGEVIEPMLGVLGAVETPEGRWKGEPLSGGNEALYKGEVGDPKGRCGCEATTASQYIGDVEPRGCSYLPDLGPERTGPRDTICRLAERPWPRLGRETVEPALLVA